MMKTLFTIQKYKLYLQYKNEIIACGHKKQSIGYIQQ